MTMADRIVVMNAGRIEQIGTPQDVYDRPNSKFVARFIGGSNVIEATHLSDNQVQVAGHTLDVAQGEFAGPGKTMGICVKMHDLELLEAESAGGNNRIPGRRAQPRVPRQPSRLRRRYRPGPFDHCASRPRPCAGVEGTGAVPAGELPRPCPVNDTPRRRLAMKITRTSVTAVLLIAGALAIPAAGQETTPCDDCCRGEGRQGCLVRVGRCEGRGGRCEDLPREYPKIAIEVERSGSERVLPADQPGVPVEHQERRRRQFVGRVALHFLEAAEVACRAHAARRQALRRVSTRIRRATTPPGARR